MHIDINRNTSACVITYTYVQKTVLVGVRSSIVLWERFLYCAFTKTKTYCFRTLGHEMWKRQKQEYVGTLGGERWKIHENKENKISGLLEVKCGKYKKPEILFVWRRCFPHFTSKSSKILRCVLCILYCHILPPRVLKHALLFFGFSTCVACRVYGSKSPEHLLRSVSDVAKDSEVRLPKCNRWEFKNVVFENVCCILYIYIYRHRHT